MKVVKNISIIIGCIIGVILIVFILDYIRINIAYHFQKKDYEEAFKVQGITNHYVPQGLAYSKEENIAIQTSYNGKHEVSKIYITNLENNQFIKELKLKEINDEDNVNHVGGITIYQDRVWITNDYEVNEYSLKEIINTKEDFITSLKNDPLPNRGDFCTIHDNILWIGDFFLKPFYPVPEDNPLLFGYHLKEEIDYSSPDYVISLPKMVQGMVITENNEFLFTQSFTYLIESTMSIYKNVLEEEPSTYTLNGKDIPYYHFSEKNKIKTIKLPPMAEGMFLKENELYILFENSSDHYKPALPKMKYIIKTPLNKII